MALENYRTMLLEKEKQATKREKTVSVDINQDLIESFSETVSLFSVDQIREQESPWRALTDIHTTDRSVKKGSPFKRRLQERKKLRILYGHLPQRALRRYYKEINRPEDLILALESRLDIVLKRSALFPSVPSARKSILQGGILVNHTVVRSPRYHCTPGDLIQVAQKSALQAPFFENMIKHNGFKHKKGCLPNLGTFQGLFVFSELLQSFDRKTGRLHTSTMLDFKGIKSNPLRCLLEKREDLLKRFNSYKNSKPFFDLQSNQELSNPKLSPTCTLKDVSFNTIPLKERSQTDQPGVERSVELERLSSRAIASRPLHLEISYRNLCVVFLYPPQRICIDISIDLSLLC